MSQHESENEDDCYGPALPPEFQINESDELSSRELNSSGVIGPSLPPGFRRQTSSSDEDDEEESLQSGNEVEEGPEFNSEVKDGDEDDIIGPVLPEIQQKIDQKRGYVNPEDRSISSQLGGSHNESEVPKREEWMTVIPKKVIKKIGFKSVTSFCKKPVAGDDEETDDIPTTSSSSDKDEKIKQVYDQYSKNKRSLLDSHQEELKKKSKTDVSKVRKPLEFDPEKDLFVRNFDEKQTKSIIEKSKLLNSRFTTGKF